MKKSTKPNRDGAASGDRPSIIPVTWEKIPGADSSRNQPPRSLQALRDWIRFERGFPAAIGGFGAADNLDAMRAVLRNAYRSLESLTAVVRVFPPDPLNRTEFERAMTELLALVDEAMSPSPTPPASPTPTNASRSAPPMSVDTKATATLFEHQDWSNKRIAEHIGTNPAYLSSKDLVSFQRARKALKGSIPRGSKTKDGTIEAIDEGDDD